MKKILLMILASGMILTAGTESKIDCRQLLEDLKLIHPIAQKWTRFTSPEDFQIYYIVKTKLKKNENPFKLEYSIYSKKDNKLIYQDIIEIPVESRLKKKIGNSVAYGLACVAAGFLTGFLVKKGIDSRQ